MKSFILMLKMMLSKTELGLEAFKIWHCTTVFSFIKHQRESLTTVGGRREKKGGKKGHQ